MKENWRVRVFVLSGIVDRSYEYMSICIKASVWLQGNMLALKPLFFSSMTGLIQEKLCLRLIIWIVIPLRQTLPGSARVLNLFRKLKRLGCPPDQTSILHELGGYNLHSHSKVIFRFHIKHNCKTRDYQDYWIHLVVYVSKNLQSGDTTILQVWYLHREVFLREIRCVY